MIGRDRIASILLCFVVNFGKHRVQLSQPEQLTQFLTQLGAKFRWPAKIYLFGGSAVLWLGGPRHTADIDITFTALQSDDLRVLIAQVAASLQLIVEESIPSQFMPLPAGAEARHQLIGRYGQIEAYVFDPYSMAVMKIDRAFESDMEDVQFLLKAGHIKLTLLEQCIADVARRYDEPRKLRRNFDEFKRHLGR
jgi:uncharacterized nucleotidyltransferase DUF6036